MAGAARIAEFFASVGFQADEKSLKSALTKVAAFGASVSVLAGGVFASLVGIAKAEADIAAQADKLGTSSERLEELRYVAEQTGSSADKLTAALESIASKNPRIKDTAAAFDLVSDRMRGMSELQRKLYAQRLGIDPTLIPMMTDDVAGLREEFRAMYAVAGTDAKAAAEESKGFLNELAKLKTLSGMLAKAVGLAFIGKIRRDIENLRRVIMENFGKIQRILQIVIGFVMRVAGAIGAFVYRIIKWAGQLVGWFDSLDDGQKKLVIGVGLLIAAWKMLNLAFLTTPLGMLITGLAGIVALVDDYLTYMESGESYFDWGPWAGTIERCVSVLKDVWNVIYAVGAAIGSALGPAFAMIVEQLAWLSRTIGYVAHILYQVFTGDLSGALETAKTMLADWGETGKRLVALLCQTIGNFFQDCGKASSPTSPISANGPKARANPSRGASVTQSAGSKKSSEGSSICSRTGCLKKSAGRTRKVSRRMPANLLPQQRQQKIHLTCRVKKNDSIQSQHTCHPLKTPILRSPRKCCPPCVGRKHRLKTRCLGVIHICLLPVRPSFRPPHNAPT